MLGSCWIGLEELKMNQAAVHSSLVVAVGREPTPLCQMAMSRIARGQS